MSERFVGSDATSVYLRLIGVTQLPQTEHVLRCGAWSVPCAPHDGRSQATGTSFQRDFLFSLRKVRSPCQSIDPNQYSACHRDHLNKRHVFYFLVDKILIQNSHSLISRAKFGVILF